LPCSVSGQKKPLRNSEEKFSKAFLHIPDIILISSFNDGKIFEVNDSVNRVGGYLKEEVLVKP